MDDEGEIAKNLRLRMEARGLGQKALALKAKLNETYVRDILKGKSRNPRQGHLQKLAIALDCRVSDLTGELDPAGAEATAESDRRHALFIAFDALDDRDQLTALRIVESFNRADPPARSAPKPKERAPPPPFPVRGNVQEKRVSRTLLRLVQEQRACPVVDVEGR